MPFPVSSVYSFPNVFPSTITHPSPKEISGISDLMPKVFSPSGYILSVFCLESSAGKTADPVRFAGQFIHSGFLVRPSLLMRASAAYSGFFGKAFAR